MTGNVLLVEDSGFFRRALQMSLESEGFLVQPAANGEDAFQAALKMRPDVIVLDMFMPKLNGMTFLRMLRSNSHTSEIPVLVLSGHDDQHDQQMAKNLGVADYCHKPSTEFKDLLLSIRRALLHASAHKPSSTAVLAAGLPA